jgi:hypothetical protein
VRSYCTIGPCSLQHTPSRQAFSIATSTISCTHTDIDLTTSRNCANLPACTIKACIASGKAITSCTTINAVPRALRSRCTHTCSAWPAWAKCRARLPGARTGSASTIDAGLTSCALIRPVSENNDTAPGQPNLPCYCTARNY